VFKKHRTLLGGEKRPLPHTLYRSIKRDFIDRVKKQLGKKKDGGGGTVKRKGDENFKVNQVLFLTKQPSELR